MKLGVATPWATDANGQSIPTHYETDGTSLTQVIEHNSVANVAYPVVADPIYWWGGKQWLTANQVRQLSFGFTIGMLVPPAALAGGLGNAAAYACNWQNRGIWVYWTWAGHVWCTGP